jgi:hypothetical protein
MKPALKIKTVMGIANARYTMPDNSGIDMLVKTDAGDLPFHYVKDDDAPLAVLVAAYLDSKPDLAIAPYRPPKPIERKSTKGGDND